MAVAAQLSRGTLQSSVWFSGVGLIGMIHLVEESWRWRRAAIRVSSTGSEKLDAFLRARVGRPADYGLDGMPGGKGATMGID